MGELIGFENRFDLLVLFVLVAAFIYGFLQGALRRFIGLATSVAAFIFAAQVRGSFGEFLATNWVQFPVSYSRMLGFGIAFAVAVAIAGLTTYAFYERSPILPRHPRVDPILGGCLSVAQAAFLLAVLVMVLDSYFRLPGSPVVNGELTFIRDFSQAVDVSRVADVYRSSIIPALLSLLGGLVPADVRGLFPA